jgi:hypothetical protein
MPACKSALVHLQLSTIERVTAGMRLSLWEVIREAEFELVKSLFTKGQISVQSQHAAHGLARASDRTSAAAWEGPLQAPRTP